MSIDVDPRFRADAQLDIGDVAAVLGAVLWTPDVLFASPPCNSFSTGSMGKMWQHGSHPSPYRSERHPDEHPIAIEGMRLVSATLRIIAVLQPRYWVSENPRGRLRSLDLLAGIPRRTVWYCRLGLDRAKPTDLWGVFPPGPESPPPCRNGHPDHIAAPRGSRAGTQGGVSTEEAGRIPRELAERFRVALAGAGVASYMDDHARTYLERAVLVRFAPAAGRFRELADRAADIEGDARRGRRSTIEPSRSPTSPSGSTA